MPEREREREEERKRERERETHWILHIHQLLLQRQQLLLKLCIFSHQIPVLAGYLGDLMLQLLIFMLQAIVVGA